MITAFHPGLESDVIVNSRPFPEITEHPGRPLQEGLAETVQPALSDFYERFGSEDSVPLIVDFGSDGESFNAIVQPPDEIVALAGDLNPEGDRYSRLLVTASGSYIDRVLEHAVFAHTDRNMDGTSERPNFDTSRYQFGVCGGLGLHLVEDGVDGTEGAENARDSLAAKFGGLAVGEELSAMDLSPTQKEHLHWMGVILKGYYLRGRDYLAGPPWFSRAPEPARLAQYRKELRGNMPDSRSAELLPVVFTLAKQVAERRHREPQRIGENYTLVD